MGLGQAVELGGPVGITLQEPCFGKVIVAAAVLRIDVQCLLEGSNRLVRLARGDELACLLRQPERGLGPWRRRADGFGGIQACHRRFGCRCRCRARGRYRRWGGYRWPGRWQRGGGTPGAPQEQRQDQPSIQTLKVCPQILLPPRKIFATGSGVADEGDRDRREPVLREKVPAPAAGSDR